MLVFSAISLWKPMTIRKGLFLAFVATLFLSFVAIFETVSRKRRDGNTCPLNEQSRMLHQEQQKGSFQKTCRFFSNSNKVVSRTLNVPDKNFTVPRIIHRTWDKDKEAAAPESWLDIESGRGVEYYVCDWETRDMDEFIAVEHPRFLTTYLSYPYPDQRTKAARYFIIDHFGGIFLDLKAEFSFQIHRFLESFSAFDIVLTGDTSGTGLASDFIVSRPRQRFWKHVTDNLENANRWYGISLDTISYSAGSMHLTRCYGSYASGKRGDGRSHPSRIAVVPFDSLNKYIHVTASPWNVAK